MHLMYRFIINISSTKKFTHLKWHGIKENGKEPVQGDGGDLNVDVIQVLVQIGQFLLHQVFEHLLVSLCTTQALVKVVGGKVLLCDGNQGPEREGSDVDFGTAHLFEDQRF